MGAEGAPLAMNERRSTRHSLARIAAPLSLVAGALLLDAAPARAADIQWANDQGGAWNDPANWSPQQVPTFEDRALITEDHPLAAIAATLAEAAALIWPNLDEALARTLATRKATYYSRSRQQYWVKGETSGHTQYVHEVRLDCDGDTVLLVVDQVGAACHTGDHTCFDADLVHRVDG